MPNDDGAMTTALRRYPAVLPALNAAGLDTCRGGAEPRLLAATPVLAAGGALSALGADAFAFGIWRTIDGARAGARARPAPRASAPIPLTRE